MKTTRHLRGVLASPRVRRLAETRGIDLTTVRGNGPGGRLLEADLVARAIDPPPDPRPAPADPVASTSPLETHNPARREPMSAIELATVRHMARCWSTIPHVTFFRDAPANRFEAQRQAAKLPLEKLGIKLTVTAVLVKLIAAVLRKHPRFNSSIDEASSEIVYHDSVNIGVATDTPRGLVVPVINHADRRSLGAVATELSQLAAAARDGTLRSDQMRGGTFTISNLGTAHSGFFTPIINHPEVAILGVGASHPSGDKERVMPLSLSIDHRVLNGADAARFLETLADAIAEPLATLLL